MSLMIVIHQQQRSGTLSCHMDLSNKFWGELRDGIGRKYQLLYRVLKRIKTILETIPKSNMAKERGSNFKQELTGKKEKTPYMELNLVAMI